MILTKSPIYAQLKRSNISGDQSDSVYVLFVLVVVVLCEWELEKFVSLLDPMCTQMCGRARSIARTHTHTLLLLFDSQYSPLCATVLSPVCPCRSSTTGECRESACVYECYVVPAPSIKSVYARVITFLRVVPECVAAVVIVVCCCCCFWFFFSSFNFNLPYVPLVSWSLAHHLRSLVVSR